jgi:hypothetical protein
MSAYSERAKLYAVWRQMLARCYDHNCPNYRWYGARGISVCARWRERFQNFLDDMGPRPNGLSLDRM